MDSPPHPTAWRRPRAGQNGAARAGGVPGRRWRLCAPATQATAALETTPPENTPTQASLNRSSCVNSEQTFRLEVSNNNNSERSTITYPVFHILPGYRRPEHDGAEYLNPHSGSFPVPDGCYYDLNNGRFEFFIVFEKQNGLKKKTEYQIVLNAALKSQDAVVQVTVFDDIERSFFSVIEMGDAPLDKQLVHTVRNTVGTNII
jgi:hypothetical protein